MLRSSIVTLPSPFKSAPPWEPVLPNFERTVDRSIIVTLPSLLTSPFLFKVEVDEPELPEEADEPPPLLLPPSPPEDPELPVEVCVVVVGCTVIGVAVGLLGEKVTVG